jgi:hypothetical protein
MVLRRIFGPNREEGEGDWRRLHNEKLHKLYASPHIIGEIKSMFMGWAEHVTLKGKMKNAYIVLVGKPEGKKSHGRSKRRWEYNIRMNLREIG